MASSEEDHLLSEIRRSSSTIGRRIPSFRLGRKLPHASQRPRRRKMPSIRLGGGGRGGGSAGTGRRRGSFLRRAFGRIRLRWLRLCSSRALRRLRSFYAAALRELVEAGKSMDAVQSMIMAESYGAVALMPVSVVTGPAIYRR